MLAPLRHPISSHHESHPMKTRLFLFCVFCLFSSTLAAQETEAKGVVLPGTLLFEDKGDHAAQMVEGIDWFLDRQLASSPRRRALRWRMPDTSSAKAWNEWLAPKRACFARYIGAQDARIAFEGFELRGTTTRPAQLAASTAFTVHAIRWPVVHCIHGEGLLLTPVGRSPVAHVVAIPDADQTPEQLAGLAPGLAPERQFARRLAESGCRVVIPTLVDRSDSASLIAADKVLRRPGVGRKTGLTNREFLYRAAFEMGRHIIGYEVQKVLAAVDEFAREAGDRDPAIGVVGYGEGGLLALYAGALDTRVDVVQSSGYFGPREGVWREPIERNVFGLLDEFGDAELARDGRAAVARRRDVRRAERGSPARNARRTGEADDVKAGVGAGRTQTRRENHRRAPACGGHGEFLSRDR